MARIPAPRHEARPPRADNNPAKQGESAKKSVSPSQHAVLELRHLRSILKEIAQLYLADREGELEQIIDQVQSSELEESEREKMANFVLHQIERIDLKPRKGRLKDIRRLDRCLKVLNQKLNERL